MSTPEPAVVVRVSALRVEVGRRPLLQVPALEIRAGEVLVDAVGVEIDTLAWRDRFLRDWPQGSDAHASYFERVARGPAYDLGDAVRVEA